MIFSVASILSSANALSLYQSKIYSFGKGLRKRHHDLTFTLFSRWHKLPSIDLLNSEFVIKRVENIVGKGENAGYKYFLLFPQYF